MGKLTYNNRKNEGSKLVDIVTRDIIKRIPPNASHKAALRDPIAEFDISNKAIGDDGLAEISEALIQALRSEEHGRVLILEEVSLKGNNFSAKGAAAFAKVIRVAYSEIRNLDLSGNKLEIKTDEDARLWERFLRSFEQCSSLRRLDLSGNKLGHKGFEILAKVYVSQDGLATIPFICLGDTGLDELSAFYLSYMIEGHKFVKDLLPQVPQPKPGPQTHQLEQLHEIKGCNGLIWKPNEGLTGYTSKALTIAEAIRAQSAVHDAAATAPITQALDDLDLSATDISLNISRTRDDSSVDFDDSFHIISSNVTGELARTRSRIVLDTLKIHGLHVNDLWSSSFRVLQTTRIILFGYELERRLSIVIGSDQPKITVEIPHIHNQAWPSLPARRPPVAKGPITLRLTNTAKAAAPKKDPGIVNEPKVFRKVQKEEIRRKQTIPEGLNPEVKAKYDREYRSKLPAGLPENVWIDIICYASDAVGVLSDNQKLDAVRWAASRRSVADMSKLKGKVESQQIYKTLEGMKCLTYGV